MKTTTSLLAMGLLILSGCATKEAACENSGGVFTGETCECPDETYGDDWPLYTYDEASGYCIDAFGIPGGELGEAEKERSPLSE